MAEEHRKPSAPILAAVVVCALVAACAPRPARREIVIRAFAFSPATDSVMVGDTVVWSNRDVVPHTATSRGAGFDSGTLDAGQDWRYVARASGTYQYQCALHPTMQGTLVVR